VAIADWFLSTSERGNPSTELDRRHVDGGSWTSGNDTQSLVHGASYFPELVRCVRLMRSGDLLLFTDWRGDPDERLDGPGTEVEKLLSDAARRGVVVKGLMWRSHLDRFAFSEQQNRRLGQEIEAAGGECLLDMRVRPGGSHHQKFVVLRHPGRLELDVAFVGGIDLCHSRNDSREHLGDPQSQPMAEVYGTRPPWHDVQLAVRGPAVADVETVFRERWDDPAPLTRNPVDRISEVMRRTDRSASTRSHSLQTVRSSSYGTPALRTTTCVLTARCRWGSLTRRPCTSMHLLVVKRTEKLRHLTDMSSVLALFAE